MKFCPHCSSEQSSDTIKQTANMHLQDTVVTGDLSIIQNSGDYSKEEQIENLAMVMIDKLGRGDMESAQNCWDQAKMIDIELTRMIFNSKYSKEIMNGYFSVAEFALDKFAKLFYTDPPYWDVSFHARVQMAPSDVEIALDNATTFGDANNSFMYNLIKARLHLYRSWFTDGVCSTTWELHECNRSYRKYHNKAESLASAPTMKFLESLEKEHSKLLERRKKHIHGQLIAVIAAIVGLAFGMIIFAATI